MKAITFELPAGVQIPDGKQVGDTFQAMAGFKIEAGGKVTLEDVDGEPLNDTSEQPEAADSEAADDTQDSGPQGVFGAGGGLRAALMGGGSPGGG